MKGEVGSLKERNLQRGTEGTEKNGFRKKIKTTTKGTKNTKEKKENFLTKQNQSLK